MTGFATVRATIRGDLNRGTAFDVRINAAIASSIKFYKARRYKFNVLHTQLSISSEYASLSFAIQETDYFKIITNGTQKELIKQNYRALDSMMRDVSLSSEPVYYAVDGYQLRFYPPPDRSYSAEIHYLAEFTDISASSSDSASNAWLTHAEELIRTHAMIEVLEIYVGGEDAFATADRLRGREKEVEKELKRSASKGQGSGLIQGKM